MPALRKWIAAAVVAVLVAAAVFFALRPRAIAVESDVVSRGPLAQTVEVEAKTRVRNRYTVSATVSGRLARLPWLEGDRVQRGSIVAVIDPLPANASVDQALAQLRELEEQKAGVETLRPKGEAIAQAQSRLRAAQEAKNVGDERRRAALAAYQQAQRDAARAAQLERSGYVSRAQMEQARLSETARGRELAMAENSARLAAADVDTARAVVDELNAKRADPDYLLRVYDARIASTQAQLRTLQDQRSQTLLRAPITGSVLRVVQKSEQFVAAGTPVLELGDPRDLEIVADVLSADAVAMKRGDRITVVRGAGERQLRGRVRTVEPAGYTKVSALGIEEQRVNVIGDFIDVPQRLGDQYRLDVQIDTWRTNDTLRVPVSALFRCGDRWCAYVIDAGRAKRVTVAIGHQSDAAAQVLSGLHAGKRVIVHPSDRIRDGVAVRP